MADNELTPDVICALAEAFPGGAPAGALPRMAMFPAAIPGVFGKASRVADLFGYYPGSTGIGLRGIVLAGRRENSRASFSEDGR